MRKKAIEALMENEQVIQTLQQKIEEMVSFNKEQLIAILRELQSIYQQRDEQRLVGFRELDARKKDIEEIRYLMIVRIYKRVENEGEL